MSAATAGCLGTTLGGAGEGTENPDGDETARTISVDGSGEIRVEPDLAMISTGIESRDDDVGGVRDDLNERANAVIKAVVDAGVVEEAVTTDHFEISEEVENGRRAALEDEESIYYEGIYGLSIEVTDLDLLGELVDAVIDAGADTVGMIRFTLSPDRREEYREEALADALDAARSEADLVATELDAEVVQPKTLQTRGARVRAVTERFNLDADAATGLDPRPGDVTVSASVSATYVMD